MCRYLSFLLSILQESEIQVLDMTLDSFRSIGKLHGEGQCASEDMRIRGVNNNIFLSEIIFVKPKSGLSN